MSFEEFIIFYFNNYHDYYVSLIVVIVFMFYFFKHNCKSIIDPVSYSLIFSIFANAVPVFLFLNNKISTYYLIYFIISELSFWSFFTYAFNKQKKQIKIRLKNEKDICKWIYNISIFILIIIIYIQFKKFGFGLTSVRRLEVFQDSGGFGIISHIIPIIITILIFISYDNLYRDKYECNKATRRIKSILVLIFTSIYLILSGARSALLSFVFIYFFFVYYYIGKKPSKRAIRILCLLAAAGALYIFSFKANSFEGTISLALFRLVGNGDAYWYAFPHNMIERVHTSPWYIDLFSNILYPLRILSYEDAIPGVGTQLVYLNHPEEFGHVIGANSRPTLWGYVMFGSCGIIFSIIWGWILGKIMRLSLCVFRNSLLSIIIGYSIFKMCLSGIADPGLFSLGLFDLFVGLSFISFIIILHILFTYNKRYESPNYSYRRTMH